VDEEVEADEEFWNQDAFKEVHHFPALFAALVFSIYPIPGYHCCSDRGLGSQIQLNVADVLIRQWRSACNNERTWSFFEFGCTLLCPHFANYQSDQSVTLSIGGIELQDDADNEYKEELEFDDEFDSDFDDEVSLNWECNCLMLSTIQTLVSKHIRVPFSLFSSDMESCMGLAYYCSSSCSHACQWTQML